MEPTDELLEQLDREAVDQARRMNFAQKFLAGSELFDYACRISLTGIRNQHPQYNDMQVLAELQRRLDLDNDREHDNGDEARP